MRRQKICSVVTVLIILLLDNDRIVPLSLLTDKSKLVGINKSKKFARTGLIHGAFIQKVNNVLSNGLNSVYLFGYRN